MLRHRCRIDIGLVSVSSRVCQGPTGGPYRARFVQQLQFGIKKLVGSKCLTLRTFVPLCCRLSVVDAPSVTFAAISDPENL